MKKVLLIWLLSGMFFSATTAQFDDAFPTGYEGDNFSLEGALDVFKNSYSLDEFERKLNTRDNWVNNLDLDFDGRTDYIRVEHRRKGDFHAIILQALIDTWDVQDVAVIEIEKVGRRDAILQIVGDEDLYGDEVVVEAYDRNTLVSNRGNYYSDYGYRNSYVNVYRWSSIQFIFGRNYVRYVSPFHYQYYPSWWSPWNRCGYDVFRPRVRRYSSFYRPVKIHRVRNVHQFYKPHRAYSNRVLSYTNKVRLKNGRKVINRPKVERSNVQRGGQVASKSSTRNKARNVPTQPSSKKRRSTMVDSRRTSTRSKSSGREIGSVNRVGTNARSKKNGRDASRTTDRSATRSTSTKTNTSKVNNRSRRSITNQSSTKITKQSKSRASNTSSRAKSSTVKRTTKQVPKRTAKKSQVSKKTSLKKSGSTKRSTTSRRQ